MFQIKGSFTQEFRIWLFMTIFCVTVISITNEYFDKIPDSFWVQVMIVMILTFFICLWVGGICWILGFIQTRFYRRHNEYHQRKSKEKHYHNI